MTENLKKYKLPLLLLILSVSFLLILAFLLFRGQQREIPLNRYLKIHCTGSNGSGVLEAEFDWEAFLDKEKKKIQYSKEGEEGLLPLLYPDALEYTQNIVMLPEFSKSTDLRNGDLIQYHWSFSEDDAKKLIVPLSVKGGSFRVSGLKKEADNSSTALEQENENQVQDHKEKTDSSSVESELSNADSDKQLQETSGTHEERQSETEVQNTTGALDLGGEQNTANGEYLFAESATRLLTAADISNFQTSYPNSLFPGDRSITQMIINEMYAKHGYIFKDQALTDYFSQKSWYAPKTTDMEQIYPVMNDVEQANVTLLRTYS
jgi:hypothetical protein